MSHRDGAQTQPMTALHPLDRPAWGALTGRQKPLALGAPPALRFDPAFGPFAATADDSPESLAALAALIGATESVVLLQAEASPTPPGTRAVFQAGAVQMVAGSFSAPAHVADIVELTGADAPEMLALATLTKPGPFSTRTHELGTFFGVRVNGVLAAMAGERMRPDGYTEVSGVCTRPDHRGKGYGGRLTQMVASRAQARGDVPFLHAMDDNPAAISLYESLGFVIRRSFSVTVLVGEGAHAAPPH